MTVGELLERMSAVELDMWQAYAAIEPFGEARADLRMGILASVIANANRDPKRKPDPFTPMDFIPDFDAAANPPLSPSEQIEQIADREAEAEQMYQQKMRAKRAQET